ncbi:hypothetical protein DXG01_003190 [Tephrocybe rancida]|nr:hypothetical protein DXG01_003190 [Tephrocybe rancida]
MEEGFERLEAAFPHHDGAGLEQRMGQGFARLEAALQPRDPVNINQRLQEGFEKLESALHHQAGPPPRCQQAALRITPQLTQHATCQSNDSVKLTKQIHDHLERLVGKDDLLRPFVTHAEADKWGCAVELRGDDWAGPCCTADDFCFHLLGTPHHPWNHSASKVFAADLIRYYHLLNSIDLTADIVTGFYTQIKSLMFKYKHSVLLINPIDPQRHRHDQRKWAVSTQNLAMHLSNSLPTHQSFQRRLEASEVVPFLNEHTQFIKQLGVEGMSSDKSDHEDATRNAAIGARYPQF